MKRKRPNKRSRSQILWLLLLLSGCMLILYITLWEKWKERQTKSIESIRYDAFGITMPSGYTIHGIDVSSYQGIIHWPSVKNMVSGEIQMGFVFMKATEGLNDIDKRFHSNWEKAKAARMIRGAYHFFLATKSGKQQALQFIKQVELKKGDLPPVIDIEKLYGVKPVLMRQRVKEFLEIVEAYYKVKPMIYTYSDFYERYLGKDFNEYPLWVAHYFQPEKPRINRDWNFWQHSETGRIDGIRAEVDCNVFNGDSTKFKQMLFY